MAEPIRCPYCVEGYDFRLMKERLNGVFFVCEKCGHALMQDNPMWTCRCGKCTELSRFRPSIGVA
jgi:rubrerythrin